MLIRTIIISFKNNSLKMKLLKDSYYELFFNFYESFNDYLPSLWFFF